jgi:hypothetical protein
MAGFPPLLKYQPEDVRQKDVDGKTLYTKLLVRLEHLQNLFFVDRLLLQRGYDGHACLLATSFEMVTLTLVFWTHMDRLANLHGDLEWLVSFVSTPQ